MCGKQEVLQPSELIFLYIVLLNSEDLTTLAYLVSQLYRVTLLLGFLVIGPLVLRCQGLSNKNDAVCHSYIMQGTDNTVQELCSLMLAHAH